MTLRGKQSGFSVVETIVSIGMFTTFMLILMGAFLSVTDAARKTRSTRIALDNISGAMDYMAREIRLGSYFRCETDGVLDRYDTPDAPQSCPYSTGGGNILGFERSGGVVSNDADQTIFRLNNGQIERSIDAGATPYEQLTASDIVISELRFFVEGTDHPLIAGDADQPRVTLFVRGVAGGNKVKTQTAFTLQTTLSVRTPNISPP